MEYVYIIRVEGTDYYKIGKSVHPLKRIKQLQSGNQATLIMRFSHKMKNAKEVETEIHRLYAPYRLNPMNNEFFLLSEELVIEISLKIKELAN